MSRTEGVRGVLTRASIDALSFLNLWSSCLHGSLSAVSHVTATWTVLQVYFTEMSYYLASPVLKWIWFPWSNLYDGCSELGQCPEFSRTALGIALAKCELRRPRSQSLCPLTRIVFWWQGGPNENMSLDLIQYTNIQHDWQALRAASEQAGASCLACSSQ